MTKEEIIKILPHRDAMLLLDEAAVADGHARGLKRITGDEWFLQGHFPGNPVVPGVILCEILGQSAAVLLADRVTGEGVPMFAGLDHVRFRHPVRPGDVLTTDCVITKARHPFYWCEGEGKVGDTVCVSASFSVALNV
ncbi:MAG: beta-hydroxyacyl-ACP dehydratase [Clostridiaceae bacterium]|nr:beta-hydroxyacyl-ACP dehydratase [Clostridiaceae bacterium]